MLAVMTDIEKFVVSLCIWREARGESPAGWQAVYSVVRNRVQSGVRWWGRTFYDVVFCPYQFSSMTVLGDLNTNKWPSLDDPLFQAIQKLVESDPPDNVKGATHYHDSSIAVPKRWGLAELTAEIGRLRFYKVL